jgi:hypothetical protein
VLGINNEHLNKSLQATARAQGRGYFENSFDAGKDKTSDKSVEALAAPDLSVR